LQAVPFAVVADRFVRCRVRPEAVNSVAPTSVATNLTCKRLQQPEFLRLALGTIPCGKLADPILRRRGRTVPRS